MKQGHVAVVRTALSLALAGVATAVLVIALVAVINSPGPHDTIGVILVGLLLQVLVLGAWAVRTTIKRVASLVFGVAELLLAVFWAPTTIGNGGPSPTGYVNPATGLVAFEALFVAGVLMLCSGLLQPWAEPRS